MSALVETIHRSPAGALGSRARALLLVVGLVLAELAVGVMVVHPRFGSLILLGLAVGGLALVFRFPLAATCGLLLLTASVLSPGLFKFPVGPIELTLAELTLGALLLLALVRPRRGWWGGAAGGALAVFFGILAVASMIAILAGRTPFSVAFATARTLALLTVFYVVVRLFPDPREVHRLLTAAAVLGAITGVVSLVLAVPGAPLADVIASQGDNLITQSEGLGLVNRVRLPGVMLAFAVFWYAALRWATAEGRERLTWAGLVAAIGLAIALSFNRNMWAGLVVGLTILLVLAVPVRRQLVIVLVVLAAVGLGLALSPARISDDSPLYPLVQRGSTLFNPGATARENSLNDRRLENRFAFSAVKEHPALGIGPGAAFGYRSTLVERNGLSTERVEQRWVHNQYVHLALIGGLPLLGAFLAFLAFVLRDVARRRGADMSLLALGAALVAIALSAIVMIYVVNGTGAVTIGAVCGAIVVLGQGRSSTARAGARG